MNLPAYRFWSQLEFHRLKFDRVEQGYRLWLTPSLEEAQALHLPQMQIQALEPETRTLILSFHPQLPETYTEIYQLETQLVRLVHEHSHEIFKMEVPLHKLQHRFQSWLRLPDQLNQTPTLALPLSETTWRELDLSSEQIGGWIQLTLQFQSLCLKPTTFFLDLQQVQASPPQDSDCLTLDPQTLAHPSPLMEMSREQLLDLDSDFE